MAVFVVDNGCFSSKMILFIGYRSHLRRDYSHPDRDKVPSLQPFSYTQNTLRLYQKYLTAIRKTPCAYTQNKTQ